MAQLEDVASDGACDFGRRSFDKYVAPLALGNAASDQYQNPVAVRYGWADFPEVSLWNKEGLPAATFRTESFPIITAPKQDAGAARRWRATLSTWLSLRRVGA